MLIVFNQMISLFLLMLTGYLANRFGVIDKTFESKVSRFIVNISLPATILNAVTGSDMAHDQEMLPIFIAAASIFLVAHVVCHFIQKIICWDPTYELMLNYSNLGFMGIPIISTIYGGEYVLHVSIFMMTNPVCLPCDRHLSFRYPSPAACSQPVFHCGRHNNTVSDDRHRLHPGRGQIFHCIY